jgi:hypothetical protein
MDQDIESVVVSQTPTQTIKTRRRQGLNLQIVEMKKWNCLAFVLLWQRTKDK